MTVPPLVSAATGSGVARLTLDAPATRNALSVALLTELLAALRAALADPAVRGVVLTGAGPVFSSGADLKEQRGYQERGERSPLTGLLVDALRTVAEAPKPVLARVDGAARAGGLGLLAACDVVLAREDATFGFAEVRVGVVPAVIAVTTLPRMAPAAALELFLTGEVFDARRAVEVGLVNRAVPAAELDAEVDRYVDMLRLGGPEALALVKPLLAQVRALPASEAFAAMARLSSERFASAEAQEGVRAFAERRRPAWAEPS